MLKRINNILPELILEIIIYGIFLQLSGMWLVEDKIGYSIGLWLGIVVAIGMAIHMAIVILDSVDMVIEKKANIHRRVFSLLRYIVVLLLFAIVLYFRIGNVLAMFIGVMGLKVAAYLQPFTHKLLTKEKEKERE